MSQYAYHPTLTSEQVNQAVSVNTNVVIFSEQGVRIVKRHNNTFVVQIEAPNGWRNTETLDIQVRRPDGTSPSGATIYNNREAALSDALKAIKVSGDNYDDCPF